MTRANSPHVVPVGLAEKLRADGFTWRQIAEKLWLKTGEVYQSDSIAKAAYKARAALFTKAPD